MSDTKVCKKCGKELPITEFYEHKTSKDGRLNACKQCVRAYAQKRRDEHPERIKEISRKTRAKNREAIRQRARERYARNKDDPEYIEQRKSYYRNNQYPKNKVKRLRKKNDFNDSKPPCAKCGETRGYVLEYHHIDPITKEFNIGALCTGVKEAKLKDEIKKCVCLCANCHKEFHHLYGKCPLNPIGSIEEYLGQELPKEQKDLIKELKEKKALADF